MSHCLISAGFLAIFDIKQLLISSEMKLAEDYGLDFLFSKDKDIISDRKLLTLYLSLNIMYKSEASKILLFNSICTDSESKRYSDIIDAIKKYAPVIENKGKTFEDFLISIEIDGPESEEINKKFKISKQNRIRMSKSKTFSKLFLRADEILNLRSKGL